MFGINWKYVAMYFVLFFAMQALGLIDIPMFENLVDTLFAQPTAVPNK